MAFKSERPRRLPALTYEQIIEVYEAAGRSVDTEVLQEMSDKMFPDAGVKFHSNKKSWKGFVDADGVMHLAEYTIGTGANWVGIMEDGTAIPY